MSTAPSPTASTDHRLAGLAIALASAAAFGLSGPFVKPLLEAGWSPAAAVAVRAGVGGLVLLPFAVSGLRQAAASEIDPSERRRAWRLSVAFGVVAVAAMQLCYFSAVDRLPVGIALLIEYLGPVLLVAWTWSTTRRRPPSITLAGAAVATGGLFLVLDLTGASDLDSVGVAWAMGAAVCLACYFAFSAHGGGDALPTLTFTAIGLLVGSVTITAVALIGLVPLQATAGDVDLLDATVPWWAPMGFVAVVSTAFAYVSGVRAAGLLGARLASFVGHRHPSRGRRAHRRRRGPRAGRRGRRRPRGRTGPGQPGGRPHLNRGQDSCSTPFVMMSYMLSFSSAAMTSVRGAPPLMAVVHPLTSSVVGARRTMPV